MRRQLKQFAIALCSGSVLLQAPGCVETAAFFTTLFTGLTTGGVFYLIGRIVND